MPYIDGYVIPVPNDNKEAYRAMAAAVAPFFKKHGAIRVVEAWGDDVPEGKITSFSMSVKREPNEAVVFSWVEWPSKAVRDAAIKPVIAEIEKTMSMKPEDNPFDGKRMIFGGFQSIVDI